MRVSLVTPVSRTVFHSDITVIFLLLSNCLMFPSNSACLRNFYISDHAFFLLFLATSLWRHQILHVSKYQTMLSFAFLSNFPMAPSNPACQQYLPMLSFAFLSNFLMAPSIPACQKISTHAFFPATRNSTVRVFRYRTLHSAVHSLRRV